MDKVILMTLRHFEIFICVCAENSMTKAAEKLHMTQPSISQTIRELEEHYNVLLFERLNRKLFITSGGKILLEYAHHMVSLRRKIEVSMQQFYHTYNLRIGASLTIGESLLIDLLKNLIALYPENQITSAIYNTEVLEKMLLADELDIALIEGNVKSLNLMVNPFMKDKLIFVASKLHSLVSMPNITQDMITKCKFLLREKGSGTRALFESTMSMHNLNYTIVGTYSNSEALKKAVSANLGITVISERCVRAELASGDICQLNVDGLNFARNFSIVYHKDKYISVEMQKCIELCHEIK